MASVVDPRLPDGFVPEHGSKSSSTASGNQWFQINNIGKTSVVLLSIFSGLAFGISIMVAILEAREAQYAKADRDRLQAQYQNQLLLQHDEYQHELDHYKEEYVKMERQFRMTELKLDDWTVVAHRAGLQLPGDYTRGPQGNLDAESFHIQEKDHGSRRDNPAARGNQNSGH